VIDSRGDTLLTIACKLYKREKEKNENDVIRWLLELESDVFHSDFGGATSFDIAHQNVE